LQCEINIIVTDLLLQLPCNVPPTYPRHARQQRDLTA